MKWKDLIVGSVSTLFVTVTSGVAVYYFTKEPEFKDKEKLLYSIEEPASFLGLNQSLSLRSITLMNAGGISAKNVNMDIVFESAEIKDISINRQGGSKKTDFNNASKRLHFNFMTLLPTEQIKLNLLLSNSEPPSVTVRSDASMGTEQEDFRLPTSRSSKVNKFLSFAVPTTGLLFILPLIFLPVVLRRRGYLFPKSRNNTGFLLLHHGLIKEADSVLNAAVLEGHYDIFTLSNLAVCKELLGENEAADRLLLAANFPDAAGHPKAVLRFNEAIVAFNRNKKDESFKKLTEAISMSGKEIRKYCQKSVLFHFTKSDPMFANLIKNV